MACLLNSGKTLKRVKGDSTLVFFRQNFSKNTQVLRLLSKYSSLRSFSLEPAKRRVLILALKIKYTFGVKNGEGGIRTRGRVTPTTTFEVVTLNRSDTSPFCLLSICSLRSTPTLHSIINIKIMFVIFLYITLCHT